MKKIAVCISLFALLGCGYFEDDGLVVKKSIVGNFIVSSSGHSTDADLSLSMGDGGYSTIINDCKIIFYDSAHKKIYAEAIINQYNSNYHEVSILNIESRSSVDSYKNNEIQKPRFDSLTSSLPIVFQKSN